MDAEYLTLAEAASLFARTDGCKPHLKTLRRWILKGCRGVCLQAVKHGGGWRTTEQWVREFVEACTRQAKGGTPMVPHPADADREHRDAVETLKRRFGWDVEAPAAAD